MLVAKRSLVVIILCLFFILPVIIIFPLIIAQGKESSTSIGNNDRFNHLGINDSFTLSGSIISTIKTIADKGKNVSVDNTESINDKSSSNSNSFNKLDLPNLSQESSILESPNSDSHIDTHLSMTNLRSNQSDNQTDSFSNNLVSMLSGIIIQSIEKGNPTITESSLGNNNSNKTENTSMIVSGNWRMNVFKSNVTIFDARLLMINADGTAFHWHLLNNYHNSNQSYFGNDGNIFLTGSADFYTDNKETAKNINTNIFLSNLETIQIIINNKNVSSHFYGYPIYGTIDKVELSN